MFGRARTIGRLAAGCRRLAAAGLLVSAFAAPADELVLTPSNLCVVVEGGRRGTKFAAEELTNALWRVFGTATPVRTTPLDGKINVFLGDGSTAASAGLRSDELPYDGFAVRVDSSTRRIFIVGEDTTYGAFMKNPATYAASLRYPHATVFGVYDFLERCFDCRFFFAGPLGTLVPGRASLALADLAYTNSPANILRSYYYVPASTVGIDGIGDRELYNRNWMYHRLETQTIPHTHGSRHFKYMERFAESHPEYFALKANGVDRHNQVLVSDSHSLYGHLCWTSSITNELYLDARSYLTGEPASVRGIPGSTEGTYAWGKNCQQGRYVDIQPNDAFPGCCCSNCQAALTADSSSAYSDIIWGATRAVAQRLLDEGIPGYVTQMAYASYVQPPSFDLPTNVMVMVAKTGPFAKYDPSGKYERQRQDIVTWHDKVRSKIMVWNYELKNGSTNLKNVPQMCPRAWGEYYREIAPYVFGHFAEAETDCWFFNHLNYYVYSKIAWDPTLSVDAVLDDYYLRMYGAAGNEVRGFFEELETVWLSNVVSRIEETDAGPVTRPPSEYQLWHEIYTAERLSRWRAALDRAAALVAGDAETSARLALCRKELLTRVEDARRAYVGSVSVASELTRRAMHPAEEWANLINNGDFLGKRKSSARFLSPMNPDPRRIADDERIARYSYSWYVGAGDFPLTNAVSVIGGQCAFIVGDGTRKEIQQYLPTLESNHTYRVSMFIRGENLRNTGTGGFVVTVNDRINHTFPSTAGFTGTFGWIHYSFVFTTHPQTNDGDHVPYLRLVLSANTYGTVFIDGVRMVDLDALAAKEAEEPPPRGMMVIVH